LGFFWEDRDFEDHSWEATTDQTDLHVHFNHYSSIKVQTGCWMIYECPNYIGHQYFARKGEYPDYLDWMGFNDSIHFGGSMLEFMENCSSLQDDFHYRDIQSCNILEGSSVFAEQPHCQGQQYLLRPSEYRQFTNWGAMTAKAAMPKPSNQQWIFPNQHVPNVYVN
ncbi:PREDICTED: LOW QUALITY PROTEIN: gamma-crystallin B-like, partial [Mesitornis unicolor]|uniref:LOW QUALITY PROTEIN: gamma-crystallin B-like n=1 Tax=Mesitornis unicolor TaxID=54374 RepID=UPI00052955F9